MDQSLDRVFRDNFHSFYNFGVQKVKLNVFGEKNSIEFIFIKLKCRCLQTGPGDLRNTTFLKFDIMQIFTHL